MNLNFLVRIPKIYMILEKLKIFSYKAHVNTMQFVGQKTVNGLIFVGFLDYFGQFSPLSRRVLTYGKLILPPRERSKKSTETNSVNSSKYIRYFQKEWPS